MNTAVLQGSIIATANHGIQRINRHNRETQNALRKTERLATLLLRKDRKSSKNTSPRHEDDQLTPSAHSARDSERLLGPSPYDYMPHVDETPRGTLIVNGLVGEDKLLRLNIGGTAFTFRIETLIKRNQGFLTAFAKQSHDLRLMNVDAYFEATHEYYFERSPILFPTIYQYYTHGIIHQALTVCATDLLDEFTFWRVDIEKVPTCSCTYDPVLDNESELESILDDETEEPDEFENVCFGQLRQKIWRLIEEPSSSIHAKIFAGISIFFVIASITGLICGSMSEFQVPAATDDKNNGTVLIETMEPMPLLIKIEHVCIVWFAAEYICKLVVTTQHWKAFRRIMNIIDLLAILPFMLETLLILFGINAEHLRDIKGMLLVIRVLRVLRVVRILKLGRYSSGLQMFGKTLHASYRQLGMLAMVIFTGVILFASLLYFIEKDDPNSDFTSIPGACWFSIVTMTTVGYGDMTPKTPGGKMIATLSIMCGVLCLALPITVIVDSFMRVAEAERHPIIRREEKLPEEENETIATAKPTNDVKEHVP
ncbi:hypothetical protein M3Y96_00843100 [Aphelenchoides besseyi]|nr:hypothetical protein M3Y96_00843100 [Aphelenchoides besseyi]